MTGLASPARRPSQRALPFLLACLLLGVAGLAEARNNDASDAEILLLPRYCPDTMGFGQYGDAYSNTSPRAGYWVALMGSSFWHMHHYCIALLSMNRAQKANLPANKRRDLWSYAQSHYQYVIDKASADFIMLPEVYTRMGDVSLLLDRPDQANQAFARARELKPDYWPGYTHWAEFLIRTGRRGDAMQLVSEGLRHSPGAKVLLDQYRMLGGKPADLPKPAAAPAAPAAPENATASDGDAPGAEK